MFLKVCIVLILLNRTELILGHQYQFLRRQTGDWMDSSAPMGIVLPTLEGFEGKSDFGELLSLKRLDEGFVIEISQCTSYCKNYINAMARFIRDRFSKKTKKQCLLGNHRINCVVIIISTGSPT